MNAGSLYMLHDSRYQEICSITDCVNLNLFTHHIFINKYRIFNHRSGDNSHILYDILFGMSDNHILTAQYI